MSLRRPVVYIGGPYRIESVYGTSYHELTAVTMASRRMPSDQVNKATSRPDAWRKKCSTRTRGSVTDPGIAAPGQLQPLVS